MAKKISKVQERKIIKSEIERLISDSGGYSKSVLEGLGVSWPPKKGWKNALINEAMKPRHCAKAHTKKTPERQKLSGDFYSSWEWKKVRYEAIKLYEQRCMCCGWQVGDTAHGRLVVDHIKPRSKFPELELDVNNLQILCNDCNMGKSNDYEDDWRSMDEKFKATIC